MKNVPKVASTEIRFGKSTYLNFWNSHDGEDVICEVRGNRLLLQRYDNRGKLRVREITLAAFIRMVRNRI